MTLTAPGRRDHAAPLRRSVVARFELVPSHVWWGATWACLCGVAAASPWPLGVDGLARAFVAWLLAVPLAGAVWVPLLAARRGDAAAHDPAQAPVPPGRLDAARSAVLRRDADVLNRRTVPTTSLEVAGSFVTAVALATILNTYLPVVVIGGLGAVIVGWLLGARLLHPTGWARSGLEILFPAVVGWQAMHGAHAVPAPVLVYDGAWAASVAWLVANGPFLIVCVAFTVAHHAFTGTDRAPWTGRAAEAVAGALVAVTVLALTGHPWGAGLVTLLFVALWPTYPLLRPGRGRAHLRASQWFVMAAMLAACAAVGFG